MDDIAGLNWTSTPANGQRPATSNYSAFTTTKPAPSGPTRASPFNQTTVHPPVQPASKPATPANDSFANLVPFGAPSNKNLSLLEQQKALAEAKLRQQQAQSQTLEDQYAGGDDQFWDRLGSGRATPVNAGPPNGSSALGSNGLHDQEEDDIFAAFNNQTTSVKPQATAAPAKYSAASADQDDDPFGLSEFTSRRAGLQAPKNTADDDDDDVLGLLGKPASALPTPESPRPPVEKEFVDPQSKAVAELVDMGFPVEKSRLALETTESGIDVQAAVGYLLNQAHSESAQKAQARSTSRPGAARENGRSSGRPDSQSSRQSPRFEDGDAPPRRPPGSAPRSEKDLEQKAAELGTTFLKTAGSLWKQGTKRVQQAVQELNSDSDSGSQPRWLREPERPHRKESQPRQPQQPQQPQTHPVPTSRTRPGPEARGEANMTDEAMMLEASRPTPPPRASATSRTGRHLDSSADTSRDHSPAIPSRLRESVGQIQPAFLRQSTPSPVGNLRSTLSRAAADEEAAQAYVSSARRRKPQPTPQPSAGDSLEPNLLAGGFSDAASPRTAAPPKAIPPTRPPSQPTPRTAAQVRPPAPRRDIPPVTAISLKASHSHREKGNDHYKRGDYSSAHQSYTTSISHLPGTHPLIIILLTNRALTALKTGEPKAAVADADRAISVIGSSKGESETIDLGIPGDAPKPMRDYYGKALMRKAEALEQMEKWTEAAQAWREAVEGGHGGAASIQGRSRAEKAASPQASRPKPKPASSAPPSGAARRAPPGPASRAPAAAVSRLRAANIAAEKADDEKFRLSESVDARIQAWKGGKADNLRALLGSLDSVLWEGSGWKKISMADLVLPAKVKVQYMKGIAKVHPDKISTDAATEHRMIAGAVFSALNEAWDKFKAENGL